jgi:CheY-like chemotaxis protein
MSSTVGKRVLFVDDEPGMREVMAIVLHEEGYEASTARDGLDALTQIRSARPDLIISDLNMPRMSGFEFLSVVRRRFPSIPVIAISDSYETAERLPAGVVADAFYPKGRCQPDELMCTVADLIRNPVARVTSYRSGQHAAVQAARVGCSSSGQHALVLSCSDCLRGFEVDPATGSTGVEETRCPFCYAAVRYVCDASPQTTPQTMPETRHSAF